MNDKMNDKMNEQFDHAMLERINPVFNTAKMTLFQLSYTGDQDAIRIAEKLGLTMENTQQESTEEELLSNSIILETRFRTMGVLAEKTGLTEVDLPCGYTPRAIQFARKGIPFVGLDLPAAIAEAEPAILSLIDEDKRQLARFAGVDATNYSSLEKALDGVSGPVCITTEGLLMYFTDSEAGQLCDNICRILKGRGGCWITADPETALQFIVSTQAFFGDRFMEIMLKGKKRAEDKSDVPVSDRTMVINPGQAEENMKRAMMFLARHGLKAERMIVGEYLPELESLKKTSPEKAELVRQGLMKVAYWKITPIEGIRLDTAGVGGEDFGLEAEFAGDVIHLRLRGRLDTLTAPELLSFFEKAAAENEIHGVVADCASLDYISSAGLRVLMMMHRRCGMGVTIRNVNKTVQEILEQTGFDSILHLE